MSSYENFADHVAMTFGMNNLYASAVFTEYFKDNIPVFDRRFDDWNMVDTRGNCFNEYHFDGDASLYRMRSNRTHHRMKFALEDTISILRALNTNQEVMLFIYEDNILNKAPFDRRYFKKQYINEKNAFYEVFFPCGNKAGSVTTQVYDCDELKQAILQLEEDNPGLTVVSNMSFVSDVAKQKGLKPIKTIRVFSVPDEGYWVTVSDSEGKEISRERIFGHYYLYDAYYSYMVEHEQFISYDERKDNFKREGKIA